MLTELRAWLSDLPLLWAGALASLVAGAATGLGAVPIFFVNTASRLLVDVLLGCAAGIMLAATCFSLLLPGLNVATAQTGNNFAAAVVVGFGVIFGAFGLWAVHRYVPHEHWLKGPEGLSHKAVRRIWLFVLAITLHNLPEGLSVGVGVASGDATDGLALTIGIFLQNLPEGFVVALALLPLGYRRTTAVLISLGTGVVEGVGGLIGAGTVALSQAVLPSALAAAGGAMLFVISHEVIPETHEHGHETYATFGLIGGFVLMMLLDVGLGTLA